VASLAIAGAAIIGEYAAGCIIVLMQTGGEALDDYAMRQATASLEALLARAPRLAHIRRDHSYADVPVGEVVPDELILVKPGEVVPVDGIVLSGTAAVDESALTGEPVPVTARPGVEVMSGSICVDGALEVRVLRTSSESQYEQIIQLVKSAQADKAPIARLADRYAILFTPFTLGMCGLAWLLTHEPSAMVAVLVVATPCPLILAAPVAIISGINRAARRGIIVKGGAALEQVGQVRAVVFDKTGTLTVGIPSVERVVHLDGFGEEAILRLAAGLERFSSHPMARALVATAEERGTSLPMPSDVVETPGQGVSGRVEDHTVAVGSMDYAVSNALATLPALREIREECDAHDDAVAFVGVDGRAAGLVVFADTIRSEVSPLLARMGQLGVTDTAMLTGDDRSTAHVVASDIGMTEVKAELRPSQKVDAVRELMRDHGSVVMVGDGINDAPALAAATVGIALGAHGVAASAEAADIVVLVDDIGRVADAIEISQNTVRIAKQSIWIGLGASGAMMVAAAFGYIVPAVGAILQEVLDVAVILNALRAR
jgi:heavy metal translocating P-type ATPase